MVIRRQGRKNIMIAWSSASGKILRTSNKSQMLRVISEIPITIVAALV
jgi:hypothetical protein